MFMSRTEAEKKYDISYTRLIQLQKKGKLTPINVSTIPAEYQAKYIKTNVKVVYAEEQLATLRGKAGSDARFGREKRRDALVFDMIKQGIDVPDIVMRTRLNLEAVKRLQNEYIRAKDAFVVPGEARRIAREHGIELGPDNYVEVLVRLLNYGRGVKPSEDRLSHLRVVPDE